MNPHDRHAEPGERLADWVDGRLTPEQLAALEAELDADPELRAQADAYRDLVVRTRRVMVEDSLQRDRPPRNFAAAVMAEIDAAARPRRRLPLLLSTAAAAALVTAFVWLGRLGLPERAAPVDVADKLGRAEPGDEALALDRVSAGAARATKSGAGEGAGRDGLLKLAPESSPATPPAKERAADRDPALLAKVADAEDAPAIDAAQLGQVQEEGIGAADEKLEQLRTYFDRFRVPGPAAPAAPAGQSARELEQLVRPVVVVTLPEQAPSAGAGGAAGETKAAETETGGKQQGRLEQARRLGAAELGARDAERKDAWMLQPEQSLAPWSNVLPPMVQRYALPRQEDGFFLDRGAVDGRALPSFAEDRWYVVQGRTEQLEDYIRRLRAAVIASGGTIDVSPSTAFGLVDPNAAAGLQQAQRAANEPAVQIEGGPSIFVVLRGAAAPPAAQPDADKRDR
jgi:hypothetical protein